MKYTIHLLLLVGVLMNGDAAAADSDLASTLMRSTFKIQGQTSAGTGFIIGKPLAADPNRGFYVLVTAAHVFEEIKEDTAVLHLRQKTDTGFSRLPTPLEIRKSGAPLWRKHPDVDVAAMAVRLPAGADIALVSTALLATDDVLRRLEVHPGDELLVLGFPYRAEANQAGFPILRSGRISSYPLTPTADTESFLLDFNVFAATVVVPCSCTTRIEFMEAACTSA